MTHSRISTIERDLDEIQLENARIKKEMDLVKKDLIDRTPELFSFKDILRSFIGSLFLGFSVLFSGNLLLIVNNMTTTHLVLIILFTLLILTAEIYFIGYSRVNDKSHRKLGQFWFKRIIAFYAVAIVVALMMSFIFGLTMLVPGAVYKLVIIMTAPCAIGASIYDLIKKY